MKKAYIKPWIVFEDFSCEDVNYDATCVRPFPDCVSILSEQDETDAEMTLISTEE